MAQGGDFPDLLANHLDDAVGLATEFGVNTRVVSTSPPRGASHGPLRVVRQRLAGDGKTLELTVVAEEWGSKDDT